MGIDPTPEAKMRETWLFPSYTGGRGETEGFDWLLLMRMREDVMVGMVNGEFWIGTVRFTISSYWIHDQHFRLWNRWGIEVHTALIIAGRFGSVASIRRR